MLLPLRLFLLLRDRPLTICDGPSVMCGWPFRDVCLPLPLQHVQQSCNLLPGWQSRADRAATRDVDALLQDQAITGHRTPL